MRNFFKYFINTNLPGNLSYRAVILSREYFANWGIFGNVWGPFGFSQLVGRGSGKEEVLWHKVGSGHG